MTAWFQWRGDDLLLDLKLQPRASRDGWAGPLGERMKLRITAPPVDGKANAYLLKFLAKAFGVPRARVSLLSGESGRDKRICIHAPRKLPEVLVGEGLGLPGSERDSS